MPEKQNARFAKSRMQPFKDISVWNCSLREVTIRPLRCKFENGKVYCATHRAYDKTKKMPGRSFA